MELIDRHIFRIFAAGLLICLIGASTFRLSPAAAEPNEPADPELFFDTNDPNDTVQSGDIFDVKLSTLILLNEAYERIFNPELITDDGRVNYSKLKRRRRDILAVKKHLKDINPAILMALPDQDRIAFWINAYNFSTIELILEHYPIKPKWYLINYPDGSIKHIARPWTGEYFDIQREEYNLKEIEQGKLLQRYKDPRICFALSNATIGGATLRNEIYTGQRLNEQLDDQVKKYLVTDKGMRLDTDNNILHLSNLFQSHAQTFLDSDLADILKFRDRKDTDRVWLNFVVPHMTENEVRYLEKNKPSIKFIDFDWHLNESR